MIFCLKAHMFFSFHTRAPYSYAIWLTLSYCLISSSRTPLSMKKKHSTRKDIAFSPLFIFLCACTCEFTSIPTHQIRHFLWHFSFVYDHIPTTYTNHTRTNPNNKREEILLHFVVNIRWIRNWFRWNRQTNNFDKRRFDKNSKDAWKCERKMTTKDKRKVVLLPFSY